MNAGEKIDTFEQLARAWHAHKLDEWAPAHAAEVLASLERDVFPAIGAAAIGAIEPPELLAVLRAVEARGARETARRLRQRLGKIFAYGIAEGQAASNPAADLGAATKPPAPPRPQPALTKVDDCRALLSACDHVVDADNVVLLASRFLALTAVRWAAVRGMRWGEVEDLDGAEPLWRIPAARMKLSKAKKGEARFEHLVPLSPQAVRVLREIGYDTRSKDGLVFPGLADGALRAVYARTEFIGRHVPHGWRASFSTILNELPWPGWPTEVRRDAMIDLALAHTPKDKVAAAYNRATVLTVRRALFDRWGELLDG